VAEDRKFDISTGKFVNRVSGEAIPDDEPVMIFRARDRRSLPMIDFYLSICTDPHHQQAIRDVIEDFEAFARDHPERMKEPGITRHIRLKSDT
jgi:hypothetical protein